MGLFSDGIDWDAIKREKKKSAKQQYLEEKKELEKRVESREFEEKLKAVRKERQELEVAALKKKLGFLNPVFARVKSLISKKTAREVENSGE